MTKFTDAEIMQVTSLIEDQTLRVRVNLALRAFGQERSAPAPAKPIQPIVPIVESPERIRTLVDVTEPVKSIPEVIKVEPIDDFRAKLFEVSGLKLDSRFKSYVKEITAVNPNGNGGYMFEGEFVKSGTVRVPEGDHLYLVCSVTGSAKYHDGDYRLVVKRADGTLWLAEGRENDSKPGWALRLLPYVEAALATIKNS